MSGWEVKQLDEVCDIALGKTPARGEKSYWDEGRETNNVWLSIADLSYSHNERVSDSKEYLSKELSFGPLRSKPASSEKVDCDPTAMLPLLKLLFERIECTWKEGAEPIG